MKRFLPLLLLSLLIASCSITKRRYTNGWHIEWNKKQHHSDGETVSKNDRPKQSSNQLTEVDTLTEIVQSELNESIKPQENNSVIRTSELTVATEDQSILTESAQETRYATENPPSSTTDLKDEPEKPKKEVFPNSERVIPIPLAVILTLLLFMVGSYISTFVGAVVYLALTFSFGYSLIASAIAIFFGALVLSLFFILIFHLYNRKQTKYASNRERNLMYIWYALAVSFGIGLLVWLVSIGLNR